MHLFRSFVAMLAASAIAGCLVSTDPDLWKKLNEDIGIADGGSPDGLLTVTTFPEADTYVRSGSNSQNNFGKEAKIEIDRQETDGSIKEGFVRFPRISAVGTIVKATLFLTVDTPKGQSDDSANIFCIDNSVWAEELMTWETKPSTQGTIIGAIGNTDAMSSVAVVLKIDSTSCIKPNSVPSLAFLGRSPEDGFDFFSREDTIKAPKLVLEVMSNP